MKKFLKTKANDITIGGSIMYAVIIYAVIYALFWIICHITSIAEVIVAIKEWFFTKVDSLKQRLSAKKES